MSSMYAAGMRPPAQQPMVNGGGPGSISNGPPGIPGARPGVPPFQGGGPPGGAPGGSRPGGVVRGPPPGAPPSFGSRPPGGPVGGAPQFGGPPMRLQGPGGPPQFGQGQQQGFGGPRPPPMGPQPPSFGGALGVCCRLHSAVGFYVSYGAGACHRCKEHSNALIIGLLVCAPGYCT